MALLYPRQSGHSFSTIQERPQQGWDYCMTKAYCKWPVIAAIIIAVLVFLLSLYCCLRCCNCCNLGRRRSGPGKNPQPMFGGPPLPYQGYQPANANMPPPYEGAPHNQYAQFDAPSQSGYRGTAKGGDDSLPPMPSWSGASTKRIEQEDGVEMNHLPPPSPAAKSGFPSPAPPPSAFPEADSKAVDGPYEIGAPSIHQPYTGPDFGVADTSYAGANTAYAGAPQQEKYTGPDFLGGAPQHTGVSSAYQTPQQSAYTPSESTRYEPSESGVGMGTTQNYAAPMGAGAPSILQAGRGGGQGQGQGQGQGGWRDV